MALDAAQLLEQAAYLKGNLTDETLYPSTGTPNQIFALSTSKKNVIQAINGLKAFTDTIYASQTDNSTTINKLINDVVGDFTTYPELITSMNDIAPEATSLLAAVHALKVMIDLKSNQDTTYSKLEVDALVEAIVASAPSTLNTLKKVADRIALVESVISTLEIKVDTKASITSVNLIKDKADSESIRLDDVIQTVADNKSQATADLDSAVLSLNTKVDTKADQSTTYTKTETDDRIQAVIGSAPAALDTLKEIADHLAADDSTVGSLVATVAANKAQVASDISILETKMSTKADTIAIDALNTKIDSIATASNVYSKAEVDSMVKSPSSSSGMRRRQWPPRQQHIAVPSDAKYAAITVFGAGGGGASYKGGNPGAAFVLIKLIDIDTFHCDMPASGGLRDVWLTKASDGGTTILSYKNKAGTSFELVSAKGGLGGSSSVAGARAPTPTISDPESKLVTYASYGGGDTNNVDAWEMVWRVIPESPKYTDDSLKTVETLDIENSQTENGFVGGRGSYSRNGCRPKVCIDWIF